MYNSIDDMPVYNWFKCIDNKDYTYCAINPLKANLDKCKVTFEKLYCEFLDTFGIAKNLTDIIELQNEILILEIELAETDDKSIITFINLKKQELEKKLEKKDEKVNTYKTEIEKNLGFRLNFKEVSVREYYEYLNDLKSK